MTRKQKRLAMVGGMVTVSFVAVLMTVFAIQRQSVFFYSPVDILEKQIDPGTRIRLGGLVAYDSVIRGESTMVSFGVEDGGHLIDVSYNGILPDLFREGQGVVIEGTLRPGGELFVADTVLAKHDENYMPREVADRLKEQGVWKGEGQP